MKANPRASPLLGVVSFAVASQLLAIVVLKRDYFVDDAGFFFRYAEHLSLGLGYRFNPSEPPVWGASAPLWPLVISAGLLLGLDMDSSVHVASAALTLVASGLLAFTAARVGGVAAGLACALFTSIDFRFGFWATSGMETPLGHFVIALGLVSVAAARSRALLGIAAGLALVHKLDFIPFALLLLAATWLDTGRAPIRAAALAGSIAAAWYGFAWIHFGSVVPNSFLVKVLTHHPPVPPAWFAGMALTSGVRLPLLLSACIGAAACWSNRRGLVLCSGGLIAAHTAAYTLVRPAETWDWYGAPLQGPLCLLAALGLARIWALLSTTIPVRFRSAIGAASLALLAAMGVWMEFPAASFQLRSSVAMEACRVEAGRWVARHAPRDWKVMSHFGNPLYYARRFALDTTRLNRAIGPLERTDLFRVFEPEVVIELHREDLVPRSSLRPLPGYRIAHWVARSTELQSFYGVVMLRADLATPTGRAPDAGNAAR